MIRKVWSEGRLRVSEGLHRESQGAIAEMKLALNRLSS